MSNCYEIVSLNSTHVKSWARQQNIKFVYNGPRKHFYKVQYVLELIMKMEEKDPAFGTAKGWILLQGSVPSVMCNKGVLNSSYWQRETAG